MRRILYENNLCIGCAVMCPELFSYNEDKCTIEIKHEKLEEYSEWASLK